MKPSFLFLILFFHFSNIAFSQDAELRKTPYIKGKVIYKDGDTINGYVKMPISAFKIQFKDSLKQKKAQKVDYKNVFKIITNRDNSIQREFYYKKTNLSRSTYFVELIYNDNIKVFIKSGGDLDLFYSEFDRRTMREIMEDEKLDEKLDEMNLPNYNNGPEFISSMMQYRKVSAYVDITINKVSYFLENDKQEELILVHQNLFGKKFKKVGADYFKDCPSLSEKIHNKEYSVSDLPIIIQEFKGDCK